MDGEGLAGAPPVRVAAAAGPDIHALADAARALTPILAARAHEGEANRRTADDIIEAIAEQGLFKVTLPTAFGGYGGTGAASVAVSEHIARGDGSASWILINLHAAMWAAGQMPAKAQDEVWGSDPAARVCTVTSPRGKAHKAPGGRILKGLWPFASGCLHSSWAMLSCLLVSEAGEMQGAGVALVPMKDLVIRDDWNVSGFRGTGSNTLELNDVFVPDHRMASLSDLVECRPPYEKADRRSLYYGAALSSLFTVVSFGPTIGLGEAAFEAFTERLPGKEISNAMGGAQQIDSQIIHLHVAEARMASDVARLMAADCNGMLDRAAVAGQSLPEETRAKVRASYSWATRNTLEAAQRLMADSGGRGISESSPLSRILRDLQALNNHGLTNPFQVLSSWGAGLLGRPQPLVLR
jgi:3-hydroxy-9,10-secoandrosta-1,3,5(10)-triene-9,17-dione monooxygenase